MQRAQIGWCTQGDTAETVPYLTVDTPTGKDHVSHTHAHGRTSHGVHMDIQASMTRKAVSKTTLQPISGHQRVDTLDIGDFTEEEEEVEEEKYNRRLEHNF